MTSSKKTFPRRSLFVLLPMLVATMTATEAQTISYLLPDIGTPGMNVYVEIIAPYDLNDSFGSDGLYANNEGDAVRVVCANPTDTNKITVGPLVVAWKGKMIFTTIFVHPDVQPNSDDWEALTSEFIIPLQVEVSGSRSGTELFYLVRPHAAIVSATGGTFGNGTFGKRSRRGAMIVDSLVLGNAIFNVSTDDCDAAAPGNQGYLPFVLLSKGRIVGQPGTVISMNAQGKQGAPGGGGGGGNFCDNTGNGSDGGNGFTPGGRGGVNRDGIPFGTSEYRLPGTGTGAANGVLWGTALNGVPGGTAPTHEASSGGTGHPFGRSGEGCADGGNCNPPGGFGGGSGQQQTRGGGGGGYAVAGGSSAANNGGQVHGNEELVPLAGGSGGASGNPQGLTVCSGEGGGGGGAIRLFGTTISNIVINADGGAAGAPSNGPGGSGSGGGVEVGTKILYNAGQVSVRGNTSGIDGGSGRFRYDGTPNSIVIYPPSGATVFQGPSTDTSRNVARTFTLRGTGNGNSIRLYLKSQNIPWTLITTLVGYSANTWSYDVTLPGSDLEYYLIAMQEVVNPSISTFASEPAWVMSQASGNILLFKAKPVIAGSREKTFAPITCETERVDTVTIKNEGDATLTLQQPLFNLGTQGFSILTPTVYPLNIKVKDSIRIVLRFAPPAGQSGVFRDTLIIGSNDTAVVRNPWYVALEARRDSVGFTTQAILFDFGDLLLCNQSVKDTIIELTNSGTVPLTFDVPVITHLEVSLVNPPATNFPIVIPPGGMRQIQIRLTPLTVGTPVTGQITFKGTAGPCERSIAIQLRSRADVIAFTAVQSLEFDTLFCPGNTGDKLFVITNTGSSGITFDNTTISNSAFTLVTPSVPFSIPPGGQISVRLRFAPGTPGTQNGNLDLTSIPCNLPLHVALAGTIEQVSLTSAPLDFGTHLPLDFPLTLPVTITNNGSVTITIQAGNFTSGTPFTIISGIPVSIPPGGNAQVMVRFDDPGIDGSFNDTLRFISTPFCSTVYSVVDGARGTATITLEVGSLSGNPGDEVEVPVILRASVNPRLFGATSITTTLRLKADILVPAFQPKGSIAGDERTIPLTLPLTATSNGILASLRFTATLGTHETSTLSLENSAGVGGSLVVTEIPGTFTLTGICRERGTRLFDGSVRATLQQNYPNPFNPVTEIGFSIIESGPARLFVLDRLGRTVAILVDDYREPGRYTAEFNALALPSGMYFYILQTATQYLTKTMIVTK